MELSGGSSQYCRWTEIQNIRQSSFFKNIYKMSAFYAFPQIIKQYFWFYGDDFAACQAPKNNNIIQYELDDSQLYADFKNNGGITVDAGNKTFTLIIW